MIRYEPANSFETPRFSGVRTFMRLPNTQDLENADVAIVGAPFDTGASFRVGARFGPEGIRSVSHLLRPYNPSLDVSIFAMAKRSAARNEGLGESKVTPVDW